MGCGSSLPPPAPLPATPCPVYPCPCACHRQGPHVPTDECEKPAPSPAERCATCGKPLEIGDGEHYCFACEPPHPEAASAVRLHRRPCKCEHRWNEHACAEPRFCLVPDCECQCFIPAHTQRADERTVPEEESDALAAEIAALRAALAEVRREAVVFLEERNAAEAKFKKAEEELVNVCEMGCSLRFQLKKAAEENERLRHLLQLATGRKP